MTTPAYKTLRATLVWGGAYDLGLGLFILFAGEPVLAALGHPLGGARFHFLLGALPLFILPALYFGAARADEVGAFLPPVLWARGCGGGLLIALTVIAAPPAAWIYLAIGAADFVWAGIHAWLWLRE